MAPKAAKAKPKAAGKAKAKSKASSEPGAKAKAKSAPSVVEEALAPSQVDASSAGAATLVITPAETSGEPELPKTPAGSGVAAVRALSVGTDAASAPAEEVAGIGQDQAASQTATSNEALAKEPDAAEPEPPVKSPAERATKLNDVLDPWKELGDAQALKKIVEEAWEIVALDGDCAEADAIAALSSETKVAHIIAKDSERESFIVSEAMERVAVSLDISECALKRVDGLPPLWLRNLVLGGNPLESLDGLCDLFPKLLSVDLSFVDFTSLDGVWRALRCCSNLRAITAESAGITSFEDMELMPQLTILEVVENEVEEIDELTILVKRCPSLIKLDLRENPITTEPGYVREVKKRLPKLEWHNNQSEKKIHTCWP